MTKEWCGPRITQIHANCKENIFALKVKKKTFALIRVIRGLKRQSVRRRERFSICPIRVIRGYSDKTSDFAAKLCHLTSDFSERISEAIAPEKNFEDFQKGLDSIWRFAAKGVRPMMCTHPYTPREKTN